MQVFNSKSNSMPQLIKKEMVKLSKTMLSAQTRKEAIELVMESLGKLEDNALSQQSYALTLLERAMLWTNQVQKGIKVGTGLKYILRELNVVDKILRDSKLIIKEY